MFSKGNVDEGLDNKKLKQENKINKVGRLAKRNKLTSIKKSNDKHKKAQTCNQRKRKLQST